MAESPNYSAPTWDYVNAGETLRERVARAKSDAQWAEYMAWDSEKRGDSEQVKAYRSLFAELRSFVRQHERHL